MNKPTVWAKFVIITSKGKKFIRVSWNNRTWYKTLLIQVNSFVKNERNTLKALNITIIVKIMTYALAQHTTYLLGTWKAARV